MATINRLIGVYDADGTLRGEVAYWIGARLGHRHCSLCDVTHGSFTEKSAWKRCRSSLPVPFDTYHRDDQPDDVRRASADTAPVVIAETSEGFVLLLDDARISSIDGDPSRLVDLISEAVDAAGSEWPA
jgi:hypothetical protein